MKVIYYKIVIAVLLLLCIILAGNTARLEYYYAGISGKITEKNQQIIENQKRYSEELAILQHSFYEMNRRFRIVNADETADPDAFRQKSSNPDDLRMIERLSGKLPENPSPLDVYNLFDAYQNSDEKLPDLLYIDAENGHVIDRNAAILEDLCRIAGLKTSTTLFWDMKRLSRAALTSIAKMDGNGNAITRPLNMRIGSKIEQARCVQQNSLETTVFSFPELVMMTSAERVLLSDIQQFPIGGLYACYLRVFSKGEWILDVEFPEGLLPEDVNLRAISLLNGNRAESSIHGNIQSFKVYPNQNEAIFLMIADKTFIPKKATAYLADRKNTFTGKR